MDTPTSLLPLHVPAGEPAAPRSAATGRPVQRLAEEFEAMFLLQIIRQMRRALLEEQEPGEGFGATTLTDTFDEEFARHLSQTGGVGLVSVLMQHLPTDGDATAPNAGVVVGTTTRATAEAVAARGTADEADDSPPAPPAVPLDAPVSSGFGWRSDPFVASPRFHKGIDLKVAYGHEVPTAAQGRVVFAGEQGGYGQTVVVEHDGGYRTRYAHLSAISVSAGQQLADGQVIGRVGRSGRATGPHLHFEVSRNGQPLDPAELARVTSAGFKFQGRGVDFPFDAASSKAVSIGADHEG